MESSLDKQSSANLSLCEILECPLFWLDLNIESTSCCTSLQNVATEALHTGGTKVLLGLKFGPIGIAAAASSSVTGVGLLSNWDRTGCLSKKALSLTDLKNLNNSTRVLKELADLKGTKDSPLERTERSSGVNVLLERLTMFSTSPSPVRAVLVRDRCFQPPLRVGLFL